MNLEHYGKVAGLFLKKNQSVIMTSIGVAGVVSTSLLTAKGALLAQRDIWEAESERVEPLTSSEKVRLTWTRFAPAVTSGIVTATCIVGSQLVNSKRQAALISAVTLGETAFREYRDKMIETVGKNKDQKVVDEIAKDHVEAHPPTKELVFSESGKSLIFESMTGRYFEGTIEQLKKAQNELNQLTINHGYAFLNDFFELIGLARVDVGDELGWNTDRMLDLSFSSTLFQDKPITVVSYRRPPFPNPHSPF